MATQPPAYFGSIPTIATAYQNDPRTKLAQSLIAQGTAGNSVAQGAWGVPDGLAHVMQSIAGALAQKSNDKKYASREQGYMDALRSSIAASGQPQGGGGAPGHVPGVVGDAVASALAHAQPSPPPAGMAPGAAPPPVPGNAPPAPIQPPPVMNQPQPGAGAGGLPVDAMPPAPGMGAPPPAGMPPMGAMPGNPGMPPPGAGISGGPARMPINSIDGGGVQPPGFIGAKQGGLDSLALYRTGIVPIEGGTDPRTGAFRTSPKGAIGPGQLMPGTAPEAAQLAGVPYDPARLRSDPEYNNLLGAAYFDKKLKDFDGDPLKAAAAYNAGSGRVSRAIRTAARTGSDWRDHLPPETQTYVANFMQKTGMGSNGAPMAPNKPYVANAQVESVPDALTMPTQRPDAPAVPPAVQSQRMEIARRMLASNNPDMVALAQSYLDKGLTENHDADVTQNAQQFERGQTGYSSELADFNAARGDVRSQNIADRTTAQNHNFQSGERVAGEQFTAGQNSAERSQNLYITRFQQANENARQAAQLRQQATLAREGEAGQTERTKLVIEGKHEDAAAKQQNQRNTFFQSPTGLKMQADIGKELGTIDTAVAKYKRFMQLNQSHSSGGMIGGLPGVGSIRGHLDSDVGEMNSIASDTTLANIGGSLGVAISDADRNFISNANISMASPKETNDAIARAKINALTRRSDYLNSFANAQADQTQAQFMHEWRQYTKDVSVQSPGDYISFDEWKQYHGAKK